MPKSFLLSLLLSLFFLTNCLTIKNSNIDARLLKITPPGTLRFSENFFVDDTEMSNIGWREYMYWTGRVYGDTSQVYLATFPDTSQWSTLDSSMHPYVENYLRHPAYNQYPLVGITQQQAEDYSKWRSDRVFEVLLTREGIIRYDSLRNNKDKHFTIERFFRGEFKTTGKDIKVSRYPNYRLPTLEDRAEILRITDSIEIKRLENCKLRTCKYCGGLWPEMHSDVPSNTKIRYDLNAPTRTVVVLERRRCGDFYNLRGNVSEWLVEPNLVAGGGWCDKRTDILANDVQYLIGTNAWTGFRNVCEWKKWEE